MRADSDTRLAYPQFLDLARDVAVGGHYGAVFHALKAAVHCAEDAGDADRLTETAGLFRHYRDVIDAIRPRHRLSTQSARGPRSIFEIGAVTAEAAVRNLASQDRLAQLRAGVVPPPGPGLLN